VKKLPNLVGACADRIRKERGKDWTRNGRIYVSDLDVVLGPEHHGRCPRQFWHVLRDEPQEPDAPGTMLMFWNGERIHDWVQKNVLPNLGDEWELLGVEVRTTPDPDKEIGGRYDAKIHHKPSGFTIVLDIKTIRGAGFRFGDVVKESAVIQVESYIEGERLKGEPADAGMVLVVDREGQNFMEQSEIIEPNPKRIRKAMWVAKYIRDMSEPPPPMAPEIKLEKRKGPDSVYLKMRWQAAYCRLKKCACREVLPERFEKWTLVGHLEDRAFKPKDDIEDVALQWAQRLLIEHKLCRE
jgi:hypothetical protein